MLDDSSASSKSTIHQPKGDCESSFTMRVKCRRAHLNYLFIVLLTAFAATSIALHAEYQKRILAIHHIHVDDTKESQLQSALLPPPSQNKFLQKHLDDDPKRQHVLNTNSTVGEKNKMINKKKPNSMAKTGKRKQEKRELAQEQKRITKPVASSLAPNATFAACLLIKDDNSILPEWLAYHYHVLRLRHLIVAVDPLSTEYPSTILDRWRNYTDMEILEWDDVDYMPSDFLVYQKPPQRYMESAAKLGPTLSSEDILEINIHRYRQRVFLAKCLRNHKENGQSWTLHIDTDEYITSSKLLRQMQPDYVTIPPMDQPGAVLSLIQQVVNKTGQQVHYPCLSLLRVLFGSVESRKEEVYKNVPPGFIANHFESLRWRYHALPHNMSLHGNPKVLLDVSAIPENSFPEDLVFSIHRPVKSYCHRNDELAFTSFRKQPIAVNHFLGSWERYSARMDKRRSRAKYDSKASVHRGTDDGARLWLQGFVRDVGFSRAHDVLGDYYMAPEFLQNHTLSYNNIKA